jgi:hypothetical protein
MAERGASARLSEMEADVLRSLVDAWNAFLCLPIEHDDDVQEFRRMIHAAQEKVLCRPARRGLRK